MVKKMSGTKNSSISADGYNEIDIRQVLTIQFHPIDTGEIDLMMSKNAQQIVYTLFVCLVPRFQSLPSKSFGSLST